MELPKLLFKKLKIGFISTMINEKMMIMPDNREGIKNSFLVFFIRTHKITQTIPIAHIFALSIKSRTHPLFHRINYPSHQ